MKKYTFVGLMMGLVVTIQLATTSCLYKNEEEFFCDTTQVTYKGTIDPILRNNCYRCHGTETNTGSYGIILEDYNVLKTYAADGRFYGNAAHLPGYIPMPYDGGKLTDCEILKIKNWVDNGYPNN
jgi:hypothetical protein